MSKSFFKNHHGARVERFASLRLLLAGVCVATIINSVMYQSWESRRVVNVKVASSSSSSIIQNGNSRITSASAATTSAPEKLPLLIGAGQGTTGTRSMYRAFCHLGIPSVHWDCYCIDKKFRSSKNTDSGDSSRDPLPAVSSSSLLFETAALEHHYQAIETYLRLGNCAIFHRRRLKGKKIFEEVATCTEEEFGNLSTKLHFHVAQVVKSGVIASLHDVPYAQMVPYIMEIARQESIPTLLIQSERGPKKWVASRASHHATQADVVCPDVEHAFDITYCLQHWKDVRLSNNNTDGSNSSSNDTGDLANLFRAYNEFEEGSDEQVRFLDFATKTMAFHQEKIQSMSPSYHVNFWTESVDDTTLPGKIWRSIKDLISPHARKKFLHQSRRLGLATTKHNARLKKLNSIRQVDEEKIPNADTDAVVESS
jgi:hypothetical protein